MNIEIKKSIKPVNYFDAINILESRLKDLYENNDLENYKKIIPCGISDKGVTNLKNIIDQDYSNLNYR